MSKYKEMGTEVVAYIFIDVHTQWNTMHFKKDE